MTTTYSDPYDNYGGPDTYIYPPNPDARSFDSFPLLTEFPIEVEDFSVGSFQVRHELNCTFIGEDSPWIGSVLENPQRYNLGSYVLTRNGFVVSERVPLQYKYQTIVIDSRIYNFSENRAAADRRVGLREKPTILINCPNTSYIEYDSNLTINAVNTRELGLIFDTTNGFARFGSALASTDGGAGSNPNEGTLFPLTGVVKPQQFALDVYDASIEFKNTTIITAGQLGVMSMIGEADTIQFTLEQGVGLSHNYTVTKSGLYREVTPDSGYPLTPPQPIIPVQPPDGTYAFGGILVE